ncbi:MAG TPA: hypothetical protein QGF05_01330, partial [Dehalococcoidia bacterium]|nr:hypothetical protein [Dehalococcoidia bacterium]
DLGDTAADGLVGLGAEPRNGCEELVEEGREGGGQTPFEDRGGEFFPGESGFELFIEGVNFTLDFLHDGKEGGAVSLRKRGIRRLSLDGSGAGFVFGRSRLIVRRVHGAGRALGRFVSRADGVLVAATGGDEDDEGDGEHGEEARYLSDPM